MPADQKAPKTAEELQKIRDNYDAYNESIGKPALADFKWEQASLNDIENFPQEVKDRLADCKQKAKLISKPDIKELKGLKHPPASVKKVCQTAAFLLSNENDYNAFLNMCTHPDKILKAIKEHEPLHLTKEQIKVLNSTKNDPDFNPDNIATKSRAAVPIAEWL